MSIVDKVREAVKEKNSKAEDRKDLFNLSGSDENKIREFETRAGEVEDIVKELKAAGVETGEISAKIKEIVREII